MSDAYLQTTSILAAALDILSEQVAPESSPSTQWSPALVSALTPFFPVEPAVSADLIAPQGRGPGLRWHAEQLLGMCQAGREESPADRVRRTYHARMLGHGLAPERTEFRPLVSIVLPVHNRAGLLVEAVRSCLDQTWRPLEILVVDDGSTDDVPAALRPFGDQVRLIRKENGGDASARNLGVANARGDFIHFLDSDDLLLPDAVANAVAAFGAVADADLCHGQGQWIDMRETPPGTRPVRFRQHANPIRALIVEFAFTVPTVMMPRWRMLALPPFEEDLRRSSDWRYWQGLGFANAKVIGLRTLAAHLRRFEHSLQATPHPEDDSHAVAMLRGLRDLLRHPHTWPYAAEYSNLLIGPLVQRWFATTPSARIAAALAEIAATVLPRSIPREELSMLPVLVALNARIERMKRRGQWPDHDPASANRTLATLLSGAIAGAAPISGRDVAFWARTPELPVPDRTLHRFFAALQDRCTPEVAPALGDVLLRRSRRVPRRRTVRLATRLQPFLGARLAGMVAVAWARRT
jgi:hypothetical protein